MVRAPARSSRTGLARWRRSHLLVALLEQQISGVRRRQRDRRFGHAALRTFVDELSGEIGSGRLAPTRARGVTTEDPGRVGGKLDRRSPSTPVVVTTCWPPGSSPPRTWPSVGLRCVGGHRGRRLGSAIATPRLAPPDAEVCRPATGPDAEGRRGCPGLRLQARPRPTTRWPPRSPAGRRPLRRPHPSPLRPGRRHRARDRGRARLPVPSRTSAGVPSRRRFQHRSLLVDAAEQVRTVLTDVIGRRGRLPGEPATGPRRSLRDMAGHPFRSGAPWPEQHDGPPTGQQHREHPGTPRTDRRPPAQPGRVPWPTGSWPEGPQLSRDPDRWPPSSTRSSPPRRPRARPVPGVRRRPGRPRVAERYGPGSARTRRSSRGRWPSPSPTPWLASSPVTACSTPTHPPRGSGVSDPAIPAIRSRSPTCWPCARDWRSSRTTSTTASDCLRDAVGIRGGRHRPLAASRPLEHPIGTVFNY